MSNYDSYYQTENLFGKPYPELIQFYTELGKIGRLLDLGCGQGRDAIPLARLGFDVIGIDQSKVGIGQMNAIAQKEQLSLKGIVISINSFHYKMISNPFKSQYFYLFIFFEIAS